MNIKRLKADFGIDILIMGGSGLRDDPFIIEPCSAADATRTQLNLLRGLERGRGELWRLLESKQVSDAATALQRLRIETVMFTEHQVITEIRRYYFDVSQVDGVPQAGTPLVEWNDPRADFSAHWQIGWLHFDRAIDNSRGAGTLNTSLQYSGLGATAAIYVYEHPMLKELSPADSRATELHMACNEIKDVYPHAQTPWPFQEWEPFWLQHFLIGDKLSVAGVAVIGSHFLKLRLTYFDDLKMRELMEETFRELATLTLKH